MKEEVFQLVARAIEMKRESGKAPDSITLIELTESLKSTLNDLFKDGRIEVGNTINSKYIRLKS